MVITIGIFSSSEGEEKEQDIFAGQGSRKQGKQGLEYFTTTNPKNTPLILCTP